jgi:hypothetical protein
MTSHFTTTAKPMEDKMAMHDWNDYRSQIAARVGEIGKLSPDTVKGYMALGSAGAKTGHLDAKPAWRRLSHEHSHAFEAVHASLPRFITLHEQCRSPGLRQIPIDHTCITKAKPVGSGPTDNLARCGES